MLTVVSVVYTQDKLVPDTPLNFPEGTKLQIVVESEEELTSQVKEPMNTDEEERKNAINRLFKSFDENPIPAGSAA